MRAIISGPRDFDDFAQLCALIESCPWKDAIEVVMSGACRLEESVGLAMPPFASGADGLGEQFAVAHRLKVERYFAKWRRLGHRGVDKSAGPKRNRLMAELADALIAIPNAPPYPHSGTWNMIAEAVRAGLEIHVPDRYAPCIVAMETFAADRPESSAAKLQDVATKAFELVSA